MSRIIQICFIRVFPREISARLFHRHALRQVPRFVDIAAFGRGDVVGEQLQRDDRQDRRKHGRNARHVDDVVGVVSDVFVAFGGHGDDTPFARADLFDVRDDLVIHGVLDGDDYDGHARFDQGDGSVLHFRGGIALGVDIGDFLEFQRAFQGDGEVDAASQIKAIVDLFNRQFSIGIAKDF